MSLRLENELRCTMIAQTKKGLTECVSPEKIITAVCKALFVLPEELNGKTRERSVAEARFIAMKLMREELGLKLRELAEIFNRDHSSVMNGISVINNLLAIEDPTAVAKLNRVLTKLGEL